jgi:hypothetical protein
MAAINIKYLKENDLYEAHQHFMRLAESYIPTVLPEDEEQEDPNAMGGQDPMGGGDPNAAMGGGDPNAMGGQDPMGGGDPNAMGGDPSAMGAQDPMGGGDPSAMGGDPNAAMGGGDPSAMGGDPMADPMGGDMGGEDPMADPMGEGEDDGSTIDIDGLTKAEDKLNIKQNRIGRDLSKVDNRISTLIDTIQALLSKVENNNNEIESLKNEFEKRNPTQTEKLNLRSLDSYPFNVKPNEYWAQKAKEGGYEAYADNGEPTTKEYVITNDDVDNPSDDIANTFFNINDDDIQTLEKIFNI